MSGRAYEVGVPAELQAEIAAAAQACGATVAEVVHAALRRWLLERAALRENRIAVAADGRVVPAVPWPEVVPAKVRGRR